MENTEKREPTHEEILEMRNRMDSYYKEQIPYLETQAKFEQLLAQIEEARFTRTRFTMQMAQLMTEANGPQTNGSQQKEAKPKPTLKKAE